MNGKRILALVLAAFIPLAARAGSTQTGTLRGSVFDSQGEAVVGALVSLHSPSLIRERVVLTDAQGGFFAPGLPPGDYKVTAKLEGYITVELSTNVEVDKTTPISVTLKEGAITETVTVTAERPVVDKTSTESTRVLEKSFTEQLPVLRSDLELLKFAPGVVDLDDDGNANFLGGTSSSNNYLIDGVSTRDPVTGTFGTNLNFDAIESVDVKLTGISAEYGQTQGGVSNVILKSGGNEFTGSLRDTITSPAWTEWYSQEATSRFAPDVSAGQGLGFTYTRPDRGARPQGSDEKSHQITTTLGGPVVVDNAWFFLSYDRIDNRASAALGNPSGGADGGGGYIDFFDGDIGSAKITWQATNKHRLQYNWTEDPARTSRCYGAELIGVSCYESYNVDNQKQGGYVWVGNWNAVWSPTILTDVKIARFNNGFAIEPLSPIPTRPGLPLGNDGTPGTTIETSFGILLDANVFDEFPETRDRKQYEASLTKFLDTGRAGSHTIKVGADYQEQINPGSSALQGNALFYVDLAAAPAGFGGTADPYDIDNRIYSLWIDFAPPTDATPKNEYTALFVNDDWQLNGNWAFNLGLRWEKSNNLSDINEQIIADSGFAPRLGAAFDVKADGRHVVKATAARYLAGINMTTLSPFTRAAGGQSSYDLYINLNAPNPGTPDWLLIAQARPDPDTAQFAPDVKPQSIDEYTLSYETQVNPTLGLSVRAIDREWSNILTTQFRYDYATGTPRKIARLINNPSSERTYRALVLGVDKRLSNNFAFNGSYTYSKAEGNVVSDESFDSFNSFPGVPQVTENRYGRLPWDVPHAVKVQGFFTVPLESPRHGLTFGTVANYLSGAPYAKNRQLQVVVGPGADGVQNTGLGTPSTDPGSVNDQVDTVVEFFEERGSHRIGSAWNLDLSAVHRFRFSKSASFESRFEVFNVFNNQQPLTVSTQWFENPTTAGQRSSNHVFGYPTSYGGFFQARRAYQLQFAVLW